MKSLRNLLKDKVLFLMKYQTGTYIIPTPTHDKWISTGHKNRLLYSSDKECIYINIPKNACSQVGSGLRDLGWNYFDRVDISGKRRTDVSVPENFRSLVIIRDPVDRWVSGYAQYISMYFPDKWQQILKFWDDQAFVDYEMRTLIHDEHTEKQSHFLQNINLENAFFVYMDDNLAYNVDKVLREFGFDSDFLLTRNYKANDSDCDPIKKNIKIKLNSLLDNNLKTLINVKRFYQEDYELIETISSLGKWVNDPKLNR